MGKRVRIVGEERSDVGVEGQARVDTDGSRVTIADVRSPVVVRVPEGIDLVIGTTSARVSIEGRLGDIAVTTVSGRVTAERSGSVDIRTESGRVQVARSDGTCRVRTSSGRVEVGNCLDVDVSTVSGRVTLEAVAGSASAHCISGRIDIGLATAGDVDAETVSGRINVTVPGGTRVLRVDGQAEADDPAGDYDCIIRTRTVSGRVDVSSR